MYSAIDLAPQVLENVLKPYAVASGWTFSVLAAGPVPEENGKIGSLSSVLNVSLKLWLTHADPSHYIAHTSVTRRRALTLRNQFPILKSSTLSPSGNLLSKFSVSLAGF